MPNIGRLFRQPLISVIIRTHDRPSLLGRALASIAEQRYRNIEAIVVDDGLHSARVVVESFRRTFNGRLRYVRIVVGRGRSHAANAGLMRARGRFICFLDDDDWLTPDSLQKRVSQFRQGVDLVYGRIETTGDKPQSFGRTYDPVLLRTENYIPIHAPLIRRSAIASCRFDETFDLFEDWDFWLQIQARGGNFQYLDEVVGIYDVSASGSGVGADQVEMSEVRGAFIRLLEKWVPVWGGEGIADIIARMRLLARHLERRHHQVRQHEQIQHELNMRIALLQDHLEQHKAGIASLKQQLISGSEAYESEIASLKQQLISGSEVYESEIASLKQQLISGSEVYESEIASLKQQLISGSEAYESEIASLKQQLISGSAAYESEIASLKQQLISGAAAYESEIASLKQQLISGAEAYENEIAQLKQNLLFVDQRLKTAQQQNAHLTQEVKRYQMQLAQILGSRSWKITAPLRELGRIIRGESTWRDSIWKLASGVYRQPSLQGVIRRLPFPVKQRIKSWLTSHKPVPVEVRATPGRQGAPKVSLIIPVYNHAEFLPRCLESAMAQTYENLEVIVCDDASPDQRVKPILEEISRSRSEKLEVIYNEQNLGIAETQNRLLEKSSGDVIAFLDCDDYLVPHAIERCMEAWQQDTVYLHTGRINVDEQDREVSRISFEHLPRQDYFRENLERMYATHLKLIDRTAIARVGLFDPRFNAAQDYDLLMRIAFHYPSQSFVHLPEFLYYHRFHSRQTTHEQQSRQQWATERIQQEARLRADIQEGKFDRFLSIIMLSFGKPEQTWEALLSLRDTVVVPHEIILFDNGSDADTVRFLKQKVAGYFDNVRLFFSSENLGPALGRKKALEQAKGDWFLVFDNDETAEPGWLEEMLVRAQVQDNVGSVCAKVLFPDRTLQFSGGYLETQEPGIVRVALYDRGKFAYDMGSARFRECDWNPIGATLFTINPAPYLHSGYPNVFEDVGVSMALRRNGYACLNAPGAWVIHHHFTYRQQFGMKKRYIQDRYNPEKMLESLRSFYRETGLLIFDEYIWRENSLTGLSREEVIERLGC
ncbi:hypothetical protein MIT9_P0225 [Methylomarinovum caldicuralii]|uniref:Glycosyltransferase 2-like domain-containing protein n=1 Tax=Methylomarinovum caldicuralii TaxID=438856 RepID=A0AAU9BQE5_9GAMM|nr:glycosyltransferase [Methylomarinovum caldicuralii]BCX80651.1 hypothetical protein MIT9_P0225 [Methylomarinovum caldicuralii]